MKSEFVDYLNEIGITDLFQDKAKGIYSFYEKLYPDSIQDIYVSEYIDEEGKRQYENLWFFTSTTFMEAKQFLTEDNFDAAPYVKKFKHWTIEKKNYDFGDSTDISRMKLRVAFATGLGAELKASGKNCYYLKEIFLKYIKPNLDE